MNIYENIAFGLKLKKLPKEEIRKKVKHGLDMVDLEGFEDRKISTLSGGQQQRIAIARALAKNPEILIFDDSFSALDFKTDATLRKRLGEMTAKTHNTVLIVGQRIASIMHADQIIVLDDGKIAGVGTSEELLKTNDIY